MKIAWFVSPHGFGHAARSSAVMAAIQRIQPDLEFEIFSRVPEWFFQEALEGPFHYHEWLTDIGLVQKTALEEDIPATLQRLDAFLPFEGRDFDDLTSRVKALDSGLIVSDIAPLGIAMGNRIGVPTVLIENFTWDWIYEGILSQAPGFGRHISYLRSIFQSASFHIQTEPVCDPSLYASLRTAPVSRCPRSESEDVRRRLEIPISAQMILITLGGVNTRLPFFQSLPDRDDLFFVIPGGSDSVERQGNRILLPHHSNFYHPDLVHACDAIVGKAGYSTIAEAYWAGIPFAYLSRPQFREAQVLANFIEEEMSGFEICEAEMEETGWLDRLLGLASEPRQLRSDPDGAEAAAGFIVEITK